MPIQDGRSAKAEPEWSAGEMRAEYGVGYALLVAMGYEGGGRVPLAGVKRQERVALQDDERLALDRSCPLGPKRRRRPAPAPRAAEERAALGTLLGRPGGDGELVRELEAQWGLDAPAEMALGTPLGLGAVEEEASDDEDFDFAGGAAGRLQRAILAELRRRRRRLPLAELVQRPRVQRALFEHPECGDAAQGFVRAFIQSNLPQCRVRQSLAPALAKLSRSKSLLPWDRASCQEPVVALRGSRQGGRRSGCGTASPASDDSSDESSEPSTPPAPQGAGAVEDSPAGTPAAAPAREEESWRCHGCLQHFVSRALLRQHLSERLCARTTADPTDLSAQFDSEHRDRDALRSLAAELRDEDLGPGGSAGAGSACWRCPACGWRSAPGSDFAQLLEHAHLSPGRRVGHQRLLSLLADLLLEEPPPAAAGHWRPERLERLLRTMAEEGASEGEYQRLEEQVLGPQEADIFA